MPRHHTRQPASARRRPSQAFLDKMMARGGPRRVTLSSAPRKLEPPVLPRPPSGICIASRRGEFRHRRAELRDGAAAPQPAMLISGKRRLWCRSRSSPPNSALPAFSISSKRNTGWSRPRSRSTVWPGELYLQGAHLTAGRAAGPLPLNVFQVAVPEGTTPPFPE